MIKCVSEVSLVGDDALCELTDVDKQQREGEDPPQVVAGEMKPCVMMDLDLGALAAPTWQTETERGGKNEGRHDQPGLSEKYNLYGNRKETKADKNKWWYNNWFKNQVMSDFREHFTYIFRTIHEYFTLVYIQVTTVWKSACREKENSLKYINR